MFDENERKDIQKRLAELGHYAGAVDGTFGPKTSSAIRAFKRSVGLRDRDHIGPITYKKIMGKELPKSNEPAWLQNARAKIGRKEITGPRHNSWIAEGWARLGAPYFNSDETPWCGFYTADCMAAVGFDYPKHFYRAKAWLGWGRETTAVLGAIVVFGRKGGGHVGFLVGQSADHYYVLGGNQRNAVNIMPLAKSRALGFRWPNNADNPATRLATMTGGIVSVNEA